LSELSEQVGSLAARVDAAEEAVSLGHSPEGLRRRPTVRGRTKTEVRDKLRALREDIASNVHTPAAYAVRQAIEDWLEGGLDGRSKDTVTKYRYTLKPVSERIGHATLPRAHRERRPQGADRARQGAVQFHGRDRTQRTHPGHQAC
jgi:hypothetical protein